MKKHTVVMIWAAALLLIVVSCFVIYYFYNELSAIGKTNKNIEVFNCAPEDIIEYSVSDKTGDYTLECTADGWRVEDGNINNLNDDAIVKMIHSASDIRAVGTINKKSLQSFDTANAQKLEITTNRTFKDEIEIRFLGILDGLCAFKVEDDRRIYVMYQSTFDILTPALDSLRISEVFEGLSEKAGMPEYLKYTDYDGTELVVRRKTAAELSQSKNNGYIMEKPFKREVNDDAYEQNITVKIPALQATAFVKETESLEGFSLDEDSRATLNFRWDGKEETLYLGENNSGLVYAKKKDKNGVFMITSSQLEFLQIDPFYLLESGILKTDTDSIQSVIVKTKDEVYNISSIGRKGGTPLFYVNGNAASEDVFEDVVEKIKDVKFIGELSAVPQNTEDIVVVINYNNAAGSQKISLASLPDKNYAAFIAGQAEFSVDGNAVRELLEQIKKASNNPTKVE
ncbi:MAG: DUF4340 domain-containing protein [Ruminococcaceae bacterium]|nr:DUF4340 domain-containing protein [Oscillospiraceae bacterium]